MRAVKVREHAVRQVCDYLTEFALGDTPGMVAEAKVAYSPRPQVEEEQLSSNVGIAIDGETIVFVQRRNRQWHEHVQKLDEDAVEKFLLWLRAMVRKDLSPENLIGDFGPETRLAADAVSVFAKLVASGEYPKATVIYEEWGRMFASSTGPSS